MGNATNIFPNFEPCRSRHHKYYTELLTITHQYPKGLGNTVAEIDTSAFKERIFPKSKFSMVVPEVEEQLKQMNNVKSIVIMGIEVRPHTSKGSLVQPSHCTFSQPKIFHLSKL